MLAGSKLALNAGWDEELLALELKELMEADIEFDVGLTGSRSRRSTSLSKALRLRRSAIRPMIGFPIRTTFHRAAALATFGGSGRFGSFAAMRSRVLWSDL